MKACIECGADFEPERTARTAQTCGVTCAHARLRRMDRERLMRRGAIKGKRERFCADCGAGFLSAHDHAKRCGPCREARRARLDAEHFACLTQPLPRDLREDVRQEKALAALEGRRFSFSAFRRAHAPVLEQAGAADWLLYAGRREAR